MSIESPSFVNLARKLSAVRATLNDDERTILDRVVETADLEDVDGHGPRPSAAVEARQMSAGPAVADTDARAMDVEGHRLAQADEANVKAFRANYFKSAQKDEVDVEVPRAN